MKNLVLSGKRIAVTRTRDQASALAAKLQALGAEVVELPLIRISKDISKETLADVMLELGGYDWIVFTSANGVRYFFEEFLRLFDDIRSLGLLRIASVGDGTSAEIARFHLKVECQPERSTADDLATALIATGSLDSAKVIVVTGNLNRDILVQRLEKAGAIVDQLPVYRTEPVALAGVPAVADFRARGADAILFASSSAAQAYADQLGALKVAAGGTVPILGSIGPQTSETLKKAGLAVGFEAKTPGLDPLVEALVKRLSR